MGRWYHGKLQLCILIVTTSIAHLHFSVMEIPVTMSNLIWILRAHCF